MRSNPPPLSRPREANGTRLFRQLVGAMRAHYGRVEAETGVAAAEIRLLAAILESEGSGVDRIAGRLSLHKSTVSNLIARLVKKKLALRGRAPSGRRGVSLRVTAAGRALLRRAPQPAGGLLQQLMGALSDRELQAVEAALQLLVDRLPPGTQAYAGASLAEPSGAGTRATGEREHEN